MSNRVLAVAVFAALLCIAPAQAAELRYSALLDGRQEFTNTGSTATAQAALIVDTATQTVDFTLSVQGLTLDSLADHVIHAGVGPVHLHLYADSGDVSLLLPFPYGATYTTTPDGFRLSVSDYRYAEGAAFLGSQTTFEEFVASLGSDYIYVNIHTDAHRDGEISGRLAAVS